MTVRRVPQSSATRAFTIGLLAAASMTAIAAMTGDASAQIEKIVSSASKTIPAAMPLEDADLPPLPTSPPLHSTHEKLANEAREALRTCDNKKIDAAISAMESYRLHRIARDVSGTQDDILDEYKNVIAAAKRKCDKRAFNVFFADEISAKRVRYQLAQMNAAVGKCDRAKFLTAIVALEVLRNLRIEDEKKALRRNASVEASKAVEDILAFHKLIASLKEAYAILLKDCPPLKDSITADNIRIRTRGGDLVTPNAYVEASSGGVCVLRGSGSEGELKVGEKPKEPVGTPPTAPPTPPGQTAGPPAPPKQTATTPEPRPVPEKKEARKKPERKLVGKPPEKTPPVKTGAPTPEKSTPPMSPETTIFVKASDLVVFGNPPGHAAALPVAGAVINLHGEAPEPPKQDAVRTAALENKGASSDPAQCRTDGNGTCSFTYPGDEFDFLTDNEDPIDLPDKQDSQGVDGPKRTAANDPTDPIDLPDKQDRQGVDGPKKTAANDPTDPIDLPDKQDTQGVGDRPTIPPEARVGSQLTVPGTSPATATLELKAKYPSSVVVKGATAPSKKGELNDDGVVKRFARLNGGDQDFSLRRVQLAVLGDATSVLPRGWHDNDSATRLAQQPAQNNDNSTGASDEIRPPPGTEVTIEKVKVGEKFYFRFNGRGFAEGTLAEWVTKTWAYSIVVDPCRDPQPGPPIGMGPQNSCAASEAVIAETPSDPLPSGELRLSALSGNKNRSFRR